MNDQQQQQQPPGWYFDPTGRHEARWWDGMGWTDHVSDHGATSIDPMRPQDHIGRKRGSGRRLRRLGLVVLIFVVVAGGGGAAAWFLLDLGDDEDGEPERVIADDQALADQTVLTGDDLTGLWVEGEPEPVLALSAPACQHLRLLEGQPTAASPALIVGDGFLRIEQRTIVAETPTEVTTLLDAFLTDPTRDCLIEALSGWNAQPGAAPTAGDRAEAWEVQGPDGVTDVVLVQTGRSLAWFTFSGGALGVEQEIQDMATDVVVGKAQPLFSSEEAGSAS